MSKRHKNKRQKSVEERPDKPDYAMDIIRDAPKKKAPEKPKEETFHLGDAIGGQAAAKLTQLKAQLAEVEEKKPEKIQPKTKQKAGRTTEERLADNPDLSFAELFDPQEDDEGSFDELLKSSKLDWRYFKDE
ncbi:hypothetical protein [Alicyclobacillus fodiniaquatilis]|uniref:Uncharacterized protein n=1 Tax=Alicyclobacillus fodiniaquatilis TaxID=1661150 RepID=A0ABW4JB37_9BACL